MTKKYTTHVLLVLLAFIFLCTLTTHAQLGAIQLSNSERTKINTYSSFFNSVTGDAQSFLFFTDAHTFGFPFHEESFLEHLNEIKIVYENAPASFIIHGGDWMNSAATQEEACIILAKIDAITRNQFKQFYHVLGNHDTNYQGRLMKDSEDTTGRLLQSTINNLLYREFGQAYYSFQMGSTMNYVLDSDIDWGLSMNEYRWSQVDWFANQLLEDDSEHSILFMHIGWNVYEHELVPMTDYITQIADAYNAKTIVKANNITYDFSTCSGTFSFVHTGHMHEDYDELINNIRVVTTMHAHANDAATFDLCLVDYDAKKLYTIRFGTGENREIDIQ